MKPKDSRMDNEKGFMDMATLIAGLIIFVVVVAVIVGAIFGIVRFVSWNNAHQSARGRGDAPTGTINAEKRDVYQMPDAFSNVAVFCDKYGNSVYVTTKTDTSRGIFALKDGCQEAK